jgi:hypothetical protein
MPEEGIVVDLEKIEAIKGWMTPNNVTKFRSFMSIDGYYIIFIVGFSRISHSIASLQKKGVKLPWTIECRKSFQHLKELLKSEPILRISYPNEYFMVCTNAHK